MGGPALHTTNLALGQARSYPTLLVTGGVDAGEADLFDEMAGRGVRLHRIQALGRRLSPWHDLVALVQLVRLIRRHRPRIVHTHTAKAGTLGRLAAMIARVPVRVHTYHGHVFRGYFGPALTRVFLAIERTLARGTTRLVTVSESQARELVEEYRICPPEQMTVIPLGLELDRFAPERTGGIRGELRRELGIGDGIPIVAIVGRLAPIKNHGLFLEAAARIAASGAPCHFAIVGGGSEEARLAARVRELGLDDRVTFLGWRRDLDRIYAGCDVVALTSDNEGTPVCLIEAMAAGCPVVSTDVGGVRDVLEDGRLGMLVPPRDPECLAATLLRLLADPALRAELGARGADAAPRRFGVARLIRDMDRLYATLTSDSPRTSVTFPLAPAEP